MNINNKKAPDYTYSFLTKNDVIRLKNMIDDPMDELWNKLSLIEDTMRDPVSKYIVFIQQDIFAPKLAEYTRKFVLDSTYLRPEWYAAPKK